MNFRLTARLAEVRGPRITNKACGAARKNYELIVEPFNLSYAFGATASQMLATYDPRITVPWSIRYPIKAPSSTFVAVVAYRVGTAVRRYKLWTGIGERLAIPSYVGETLPPGAVLEIWTVPDQIAQLPTQWKLLVGFLQMPLSPCDQDGADIIPAVCQAAYPGAGTLNALFNTCAY